MGLNDEVVLARRTGVLFLLIDTSDSMKGTKINSLNQAIEEIMPDLRTFSAENSDFEIKIAAMRFSSGVEWVTKGEPVSVEKKFIWPNPQAGGRSNMGAAFKELAKKLSAEKGGFIPHGSYAPAIFMFSGSEPDDDFEGGLAVLKQNTWFKGAVKAAFAIGADANQNVLARFTGSPDAVMAHYDPETLMHWIWSAFRLTS